MRTFVATAPPTATRAAVAAAPGEMPRTAAFAGSMRTVRCGAAVSAPVCTFTVPGQRADVRGELVGGRVDRTVRPGKRVADRDCRDAAAAARRHLHLRALRERRHDLAQRLDEVVLGLAMVLEQRDAELSDEPAGGRCPSPTASGRSSSAPCRRTAASSATSSMRLIAACVVCQRRSGGERHRHRNLAALLGRHELALDALVERTQTEHGTGHREARDRAADRCAHVNRAAADPEERHDAPAGDEAAHEHPARARPRPGRRPRSRCRSSPARRRRA